MFYIFRDKSATFIFFSLANNYPPKLEVKLAFLNDIEIYGRIVYMGVIVMGHTRLQQTTKLRRAAARG